MNDLENLDALIARVPRELAPPATLWRGIERGIAPRARRHWPQALAAGVAIAALSAALTATFLTRPGAESAAERTASENAAGFAEPRDAAYRATRASLRHDFEARLALLPPGTQADIAKSLATIRHAEADLRRSLGEDPTSPLLERLLQATWNDELELYADVIRSTQPALTRTST